MSDQKSSLDNVGDINKGMIEQFRANEGRLGGPFEGTPVLLLHTTGAKSGLARVNPMMYQDLGDGRLAVFASKAGADTHPDWYHNLVANPAVSAEIGTEARPFSARVAGADEREPIWAQQKKDYPGFADYEAGTSRVIPVVVLDPA